MSSMEGDGSGQKSDEVNIKVEVREIDQILKAPEKDPFSDIPVEYMGQSAIERCIRMIRVDRGWHRRRYRFTFLAPPDQVGKRSVVEIKQGLMRFCDTQQADNDIHLGVIREKGLRQLPYCFAILFVSVTLGVIIGSDQVVEVGGLAATAISEGLYIIGWVSLWGPTETLLFEPMELKRQNKALRLVKGVQIELIPKV
jgi:hypothetical protein